MFSEPAKILEPFSGGAEHQEGPRVCALNLPTGNYRSPETFFFF